MASRAGLTGIAILALALVLAACGSSAPTTGAPSGTGPASTDSGVPATAGAESPGLPGSPSGLQTPGPTVQEAFCGVIAGLDDALSSFQAIKVKPQNKQQLVAAAGALSTALSNIQKAIPALLRTKLNALKSAVTGVSSAAEDYSTTAKPAVAAARIKKAETTLKAQIAAFRAAAACTN